MKQIIKNIPKDYYNLAVVYAVHTMVMDTINKCMSTCLYAKEIKERKFQQEIVQMLALTLLFFTFFCFVYLAIHP